MSKTLHLLEQAARFDRVADQCSVPELIPYYRERAEDYRQRAAVVAMSPGEEPPGEDVPVSPAAEQPDLDR